MTSKQNKSAQYYLKKAYDALGSSTNEDRHNIFPIRDGASYEFFKRQEAALWSTNEMDFIRDRQDYQSLDEKKKRLVKVILGFFAPGDGLVARNLCRYLLECERFEKMAFLAAQLFIEVVHAEGYGLAISTMLSEEEQKEVFSMSDNVKSIKALAEWMEKYYHSELPAAERYLAYACSEGIFFCVLFAVIFWFRSKGILQNFIFLNEQIAKDETLHRDFGCHRYNEELNGEEYQAFLKEGGFDAHQRAIDIINESVILEDAVIDDLIPEPIDELNKEDLKAFARTVADNLLVQIGYPPQYRTTNKFSWMSEIANQQKGNFYEVRIGSYKQTSLKKALDWKGRIEPEEKSIDPTVVDF